MNPKGDRTCECIQLSWDLRYRPAAASPFKARLFRRNIGEHLNNGLPARPTFSGFAANRYPIRRGSLRVSGKIPCSSAGPALRDLNQGLAPLNSQMLARPHKLRPRDDLLSGPYPEQ